MCCAVDFGLGSGLGFGLGFGARLFAACSTYVERFFCFVPFHPLAVLRGGNATQQDFVFLQAADGGGGWVFWTRAVRLLRPKLISLHLHPCCCLGLVCPLSLPLSRSQVSYHTRNLLCVLQLHDGPILSLEVNEDYAITASEDKFLRLWPLDFSDFLMEAAHEVRLKTRRERERKRERSSVRDEKERERQRQRTTEKQC